MQPNKTTGNTTERIKEIIDKKYKQNKQELSLCKVDVYLVLYNDDWKSVLGFQDWTALRTLSLCYSAITQKDAHQLHWLLILSVC